MIFFFGFCVFIHEFGHLLAAIWCKLHIERFSVGFGKPIWKRVIKGVEYRLGWLPFGGYVALPQMEPTDEPQTYEGEPLPSVHPFKRIIVAVAGPLFNILFGIFLASIIWLNGVKVPVLHQADGDKAKSFVVGHIQDFIVHEGDDGKEEKIYSPEAEAGLERGDEVIAVNGTKLKKGWEEALKRIIFAKAGEVTLTVIRDGQEKEINYKLKENPDYDNVPYPFFQPSFTTIIGPFPEDRETPAKKAGLLANDVLVRINGKDVISLTWCYDEMERIKKEEDKTLNLEILRHERNDKGEITSSKEMSFTVEPELEERFLYGIKIQPKSVQPIITVSDNYPASEAGMEDGDLITKVNGQDILDASSLFLVLAKSANQEKNLEIELMRGNEKKSFSIKPVKKSTPDKHFLYGINLSHETTTIHPTPIDQLQETVMMSYYMIMAIIDKNNPLDASKMSGPVGISDAIQKGFSIDFFAGLRIVGIISFSLAIFNLLPLPILDGGHITIAIIEMLSRKKIPSKLLQPVFYAFFIVLITFAIYVTYHDLGRFFKKNKIAAPDRWVHVSFDKSSL